MAGLISVDSRLVIIGDAISLLSSRAEVDGNEAKPGNNHNMKEEGNNWEEDGRAHVSNSFCSLFN